MELRNNGLDLLKFFCCFCVIVIHCEIPLDGIFAVLTRCAVPCFYIVTGYFILRNFDKYKIVSVVKKLTRLLLFSTIIFLIYRALISTFSVGEFCKVKYPVFDFLVFNEHPFGYHLWYISACIYGLIILYVLSQRLNIFSSKFILFTVVFTQVGTFIGLMEHANNESIWCFRICVVRNFLFTAIPYLILGGYFSKKHLSTRITPKILFCVLLGIYLLSIVEYNYVTENRNEYVNDSLLLTWPLSAIVFLCFSYLRIEVSVFTKIGKESSLFVYIIHPIIKMLVTSVSNYMGSNIDKSWLFPIAVMLVSVLLYYVLLFLKTKILTILKTNT